MIGQGIKSESTGVIGWHTLEEERALIALVKQYVPDKDGVIVEVGCEYGKSTAEFAYAARDKLNTRIVSVDLFPDDHHIAGYHGGLLAVWKSNLAESGVTSYPAYIIPVRAVSWEAGENWQEPIDLLFIDAGHHYDEVKKDIAAWVDHVKPGGAVVFHDVWKDENSHPIHKEVLQAVEEWYSKHKGGWERFDAPDSLLYFVRKAETKAPYAQTTMEGRASADKPTKKTAKAKTTKGATSGKRTGKRSTK